MIKANELRKGIIIQDYTGVIREVYGEDIQQQCWHEEGQTGTLEAPLNPIPLTPEWLERCGFEWDNGYLKIDLKNARMKLGFFKGARDKMTLFQTSCPSDGSKITTLQFGWNHPENIHQLQNLYFALTGEELTITSL